MIRHYNLTLSGLAQNLLAAATAASETSQEGATANLPMRAIWLQPHGDNAGPIFLGATSGVTSANYGVRLDVGNTGTPPAPFNPGEFSSGPMKLSDFWVLGNLGESLHILAVPF